MLRSHMRSDEPLDLGFTEDPVELELQLPVRLAQRLDERHDVARKDALCVQVLPHAAPAREHRVDRRALPCTTGPSAGTQLDHQVLYVGLGDLLHELVAVLLDHGSQRDGVRVVRRRP